MIDKHIPQCKHKRCKRRAMVNGGECPRHWMKTRGWNKKAREYLPFDGVVNGPTWDDQIESTRQEA